ncbi:hypothetical protein [Sciscionella sediminilitoris]|uniref:hypothetical protein n=1 Tax=Sciscionella sediminilitoris TaxID=1445613 RepID=UPI0004DF2607|nr:hypothetical protein [Sciscionella sp. SE31]
MPVALTVVIVVLGLLAIAGLSAFIVRMLRSRPDQVGEAAVRHRAPIGSTAQVWEERAERAVRELSTRAAELPALLADAQVVLDTVHADAATVAELNASMAEEQPNRLRAQYERLADRERRMPGAQAEAATGAARRRLGAVQARIAERDRLLEAMEPAVLELEATVAELGGLQANGVNPIGADGTAVATLRAHVTAIRGAYAEVNRLNPGPGEPIRAAEERATGDTGPVAGQG